MSEDAVNELDGTLPQVVLEEGATVPDGEFPGEPPRACPLAMNPAMIPRQLREI